jgi:hypothetical protein
MKIYNISDHPKFVSVDVKYLGGTIKPGYSTEVIEDMVPKADCIVVTLPSWYVEWKNSPLFIQKKVPLPPLEVKDNKEDKSEEIKRKKGK